MTVSTLADSGNERAQRLHRTRAIMEAHGLDALVLVSPENIYYLAGLNHYGYFAPTFLLVARTGRMQIIARSMERPTIDAQAVNCEHLFYDDGEDSSELLARALNALNPSRIGIEESSMYLPVQVWVATSTYLHGVATMDCSNLVFEQRAVKSPFEIDLIRSAGAMSDRALSAGIEVSARGVSEREVARTIYGELIDAGSDVPAFPPMIRTSENIPQEHMTWRSDRVLRDGDRVFIELGGSSARYHAPTSRIFYVGDKPHGVDASARAVLAGFDAICESLRPGAKASYVYERWHGAISREIGHSDYHRHHCGYLTGIGFPPTWCGTTPVGLRRKSSLIIEEGMVFHAMSWLIGQRTPDYGISDTVVITQSGCDVVTTVPRMPMVV